MSALAQHFYTVEQSLELERAADTKSEYLSGQIFAMSGGTPTHRLIGSNLIGELYRQLKGHPCRTYNSDLRVTVMQTGLKTYPDITVVCGEPYFHPPDKEQPPQPTVRFEVLSPSTEGYDRGEK